MANNQTSSDDFDKLLDEFIASQLQETESAFDDTAVEKKTEESSSEDVSLSDIIKEAKEVEQGLNLLALEERRLYNALCELRFSAKACGDAADFNYNDFILVAEDLLPRFRPSRMEKINHDILNAWEILISTQAPRLSSLPQNASDEQILSFAEKTTDKHLQIALISYVETLIELDACEIAYNLRRVKYEKHKIERKLYEEQQERRDRMRRYIAAIKKKCFPVDAEMLVNNFFKTVRKDPEGAKKVLEKNPATCAPIQVDKIPPKFFGLIKPKPEDGIKINKKLGKFLKKLKA